MFGRGPPAPHRPRLSTEQQSPRELHLLPVTPSPAGSATQQLTGFLAVVSAAEDGRAAMRAAVERAAVALEAEVAALVWGGDVAASVGFPADPALELAFVEVAEARSNSLVVPGVGTCPAVSVPVGGDVGATLVVARSANGGFAVDELHLAGAMAHVLGLSLRMFRLADEERRQRHEAETQAELSQRLFDSLQSRQQLLERLARIQRSIAHGAPREEVLDAICRGAQEFVGDDLGGLRLLAPDDPSQLELVAFAGDLPERRGNRSPLDAGVGGRAVTDARLVAVESLGEEEGALPSFEALGLQAAMAAPVHDHGRVVGSLIVGSFARGRRYSSIERDTLIAFATNASLAISDSSRREDPRHADAEGIPGRLRHGQV
jgi:GAF domain